MDKTCLDCGNQNCDIYKMLARLENIEEMESLSIKPCRHFIDEAYHRSLFEPEKASEIIPF